MRLNYFLTSTVLGIFLPLTQALPQGAASDVSLVDRSSFNAVCSTPNVAAVGRATSKFVTTICCPPHNPTGGWSRPDNRPVCCNNPIRCNEYSKGNVTPVNVVRCEGPKNAVTSYKYGKEKVKVCQAPGNAKMSEKEVVESSDSADTASSSNSITTISTTNNILALRDDPLGAICSNKNFVSTLAVKTQGAIVHICCPFIFPQGGWEAGDRPICCPAGATIANCSKGEILHVDAVDVVKCIGAENYLSVAGNNVEVCAAPGSTES